MVRKANSLSLYKDILDILNSDDFELYWRGFEKAPFALYNLNKVILCNHPNPPEGYIDMGDHYLGPWNKHFVGNRVIKLNGVYTVIWDIDTIEPNISIDVDVLYSKLVHKMFHCYQKSLGEKRWADERLFINYNFSVESLALRLMDKDFLICALDDQNKYTRDKLLADFINRRQMRKNIVGNKLSYELALESTEGPAYYIEFKVLAKLKSVALTDLISERLRNFSFDDLNDYRHSCHEFGMFMCVVLDSISPGWYEEYMNSNIYLFKFLRSKVGFFNELIDFSIDPFYIYTAKEIIKKYDDYRINEFKNYSSTKGYRIIISGSFELKDFDPLNIVSMDNKVLHKSFITFDNIDIKGTCLSTHGEDFFNLKSVEFITSKEPQISDNCISTERGVFHGRITHDGSSYTVELIEDCDK